MIGDIPPGMDPMMVLRYDQIYEVGSTEPVAYIDCISNEMFNPWEVPWFEQGLPNNYAKVAAE